MWPIADVAGFSVRVSVVAMKTLVAALVASLCCAACEAPVERVAGADSDFLSETDLRRLTYRAERSDAEAAFRVGTHFSAQPQRQREAVDWLRLAAENNHNTAAQHLIVHLNARGDCDEARSWLERLDQRVTNRQERELLGVDDMIADSQSDYETCASQAD
jgi:TPR repeat protein